MSKNYTDSRNGWGASLVDAMPTMVSPPPLPHLMTTQLTWISTVHHGARCERPSPPLRPHRANQPQDLFHEAVDYVSGVDFSESKTDDTVRSVDAVC